MHLEYNNHGHCSIRSFPYLHTARAGKEHGNLEDALNDPNINVSVHAALLTTMQKPTTAAPFEFMTGKIGPEYVATGSYNLVYLILAEKITPRKMKIAQKLLGQNKKEILAIGGEELKPEPQRGLKKPKDYMALLIQIVKKTLEKTDKVTIHSYETGTELSTDPYLRRALQTFTQEHPEIQMVENR